MDRADLTFGGAPAGDDCAKETELYSLKQELKDEESEREKAFWAFADSAYKECTRGTFSVETIKNDYDTLCEINARIVALEERINLAESREEREKDRNRQILEAQKSKLEAAELVEQSKVAADEAMKKALELQEELERAQEKAKEAEAEEQKLLGSLSKTELVEVVPFTESAETPCEKTCNDAALDQASSDDAVAGVASVEESATVEVDDSAPSEVGSEEAFSEEGPLPNLSVENSVSDLAVDAFEVADVCPVDSTEDISVVDAAVVDPVPVEDDSLAVDSESDGEVEIENNSGEPEQEAEPAPEPVIAELEPAIEQESAEYESIFDRLVHKEEAPKAEVEPANVVPVPEPQSELEPEAEPVPAIIEPEPEPEPVATVAEVAPQHFNICPNCGAEFEAGCKFCGLCGSKLPEADASAAPKHCMSCGKPLEPGASFCIYCGAHV